MVFAELEVSKEDTFTYDRVSFIFTKYLISALVKNQIFLSHSSEDRQIVQYFVDKFNDTGIKPVLMEFEKWSRNRRPNWLWIKDEMKKSMALFLLLSKNLIGKPQTQNWISFEIGLASMLTPPIPVFVFEEEKVHFPVPYLSHYFDQSFSRKTGLFIGDFSETSSNVSRHATYESYIDELIKGPSIGLSPYETIKCSECLLRFHYWGEKEYINCPCCSSSIKISGPKMKDLLDI